VIISACCLPTTGQSTESGPARNVNSSLKAFIAAISRATGIRGSAFAKVPNEGRVVSIRKANVPILMIMAKIDPVRVHGSGFFIPINFDGSTNASI